VIVDGTLIQVVDEMKNAAIGHEEVLTITLVKHKEEMESVMGCLKKIEQKFLETKIEKEAWHAKCLSFEMEVQLL
jgi:hypothetical protein